MVSFMADHVGGHVLQVRTLSHLLYVRLSCSKLLSGNYLDLAVTMPM